MSLICLGLSHRTAPAGVRERHAFPSARISEALVALLDYEAVREAAILSTCGRIEIYADVNTSAPGIAQLKQFLVAFRHGEVEYDIQPYLYTLTGGEAVDHLLRVATGIDSMLIGEAEILGQIKEAYDIAQSARSSGTILHRLFREALNAGKQARSRTGIGGDSVSAATAAVAVAREHVGTLTGKMVLLVGAGRMGLKVAKRLKIAGASAILVANRTRDRATDIVEQVGMGDAVDMPLIADALQSADVVITSTGAPHFILTPELVGSAMQARGYRPLCIVDIAVPRDVDPDVGHLPGVHVVDIDQLGATVDVTLEQRRTWIPAVERIIAQHLARFNAWYRARVSHPVISSLSQKAEAIREAEVARLLSRCPGLSAREQMLVTGMSLRIVSKLMHAPFSTIRKTAMSDAERAAMQHALIDELFELGVGLMRAAPTHTAGSFAEAFEIDSLAEYGEVPTSVDS